MRFRSKIYMYTYIDCLWAVAIVVHTYWMSASAAQRTIQTHTLRSNWRLKFHTRNKKRHFLFAFFFFSFVRYHHHRCQTTTIKLHFYIVPNDVVIYIPNVFSRTEKIAICFSFTRKWFKGIKIDVDATYAAWISGWSKYVCVYDFG